MNVKLSHLVLVATSTICALAAGRLLVAQEAPPANTITTPDMAPAFLFEAESAFDSLKNVALWRELEQMLDDPYAVELCNVEGNAQGYPSYCSTITRRRSFLPAGCTYDPTTGLPPCDDSRLEPFLMHPLNYNNTTGEEFRLLNPDFPGVADFAGMGPISPGADRIEPGEPAIDYNSPIYALPFVCITLEGQQLCGDDPGEPEGYSYPAVCGDNPISGWVETRPVCAGNVGKLYDPTPDEDTGQPRGIIESLEKPSIGQDYTVNSMANLDGVEDTLQPSNPNDYYSDLDMATVMGKALFWDMQLGSDGVQSCGTCHFSAGIDTRTRNQLNPSHLGGDSDLEIFRNRHLATPPNAADQNVNRDVVRSDFPLHKLTNPEIPGEPLLNPGNVISDTNDIMSSMGVRFRRFSNIPIPGSGAFSPAANGVRAVLPDIGVAVPDPIPLFQGLRRIEPRNTPTMINAAFNFDNFWDGRARHDFNGGSVFGASDPQGHVFADTGNGIEATRQIIRFASLASLFTGPALSDFEMGFAGRNWPKIGKKL
ncbi:MAG TPA: hypothetical protein VJ484_13735, partial [Lysobacter sp.]|nr:hypothetical protein [Lysobacter sp.]